MSLNKYYYTKWQAIKKMNLMQGKNCNLHANEAKK